MHINHTHIQGDQNLSLHLVITVKKHTKIFSTVSISYHDNVFRVRDDRWRYCESSVPLALTIGCQKVRLSGVAKCIVTIRRKENV
jgi:hypothetical protein